MYCKRCGDGLSVGEQEQGNICYQCIEQDERNDREPVVGPEPECTCEACWLYAVI